MTVRVKKKPRSGISLNVVDEFAYPLCVQFGLYKQNAVFGEGLRVTRESPRYYYFLLLARRGESHPIPSTPHYSVPY